MKILVGDLEADGFLDEATRVWCGSLTQSGSGVVDSYGPDEIPEFLHAMEQADVLVFHNGLGYDFPLLKKLYNWEFNGAIVDTLLMSRLQRPDRKLPKSCPNRGAKPHSIEAWGYRVGRGKPEHNDWSQYTPEMGHRCDEDALIGDLTYQALKKEGGPAWRNAHALTHDLFKILYEQEKYGWLFDLEFSAKAIHMLDHWVERIDKIVVPNLPLVMEIQEQKKAGEYNYVRKPFLKSGAYSKSAVAWLEGGGYDASVRSIVAAPFSRISYRPVNLNSNKEVKDWLLREGWEPEEWNYKKDEKGRYIYGDDGERIKTSPVLNGDDPFNGVSGLIGSLIARRVQCRHRKSQIEGWIKRLRPDGRLSQVITGICTTGRLKHSGIVNVPGEDAFFGDWMRKCFIAKPGYKIVGVDSAGCQNRMLAARVGNDAFTETLINGKKEDKTSIHHLNQRAIADAGIKVTYKQSKNLNYAFMFGARDPKLGSTIGKGPKEGAIIRAALLGVAPGFEELVNSLTEEWKSNAKQRINRWGRVEYYEGWCTGLDGRPIHIESEHQILVYMLQSDEAILMQHALVLLKSWLDEEGWTHGVEYGFVANVHDEYQAEVRDDCVDRYCELATKAIEVAAVNLEIACPHKGEADVGVNWKETH